jgi:hypothetical protein
LVLVISSLTDDDDQYDDEHQEKGTIGALSAIGFARATQVLVALWLGVSLAFVITSIDSAIGNIQNALGILVAYSLVNATTPSQNTATGNYFVNLYASARLATGSVIIWVFITLASLLIFIWVSEKYKVRGPTIHPRNSLLLMYIVGLLVISFFPIIIRWASIGSLWFPYTVVNGAPTAIPQPSVLPNDTFAGLASTSTEVSSIIVFSKYFILSVTLIVSIELMWFALTFRTRSLREFLLLQITAAAIIASVNTYQAFNTASFSILDFESVLDPTGVYFVQYATLVLFIIGVVAWGYGIYDIMKDRGWLGTGMRVPENFGIEKPKETAPNPIRNASGPAEYDK